MEKNDRWLAGILVLIVLAYAWLAAWMLEPRWQPSTSVTSGVAWLENGRVYSSSEIGRRHLGLLMRVQDEMKATESALAMLGPYRFAPSVIIHLHGGLRYAVDAERVDLSDQIAAAPGQLTKAMLKAWWYQRPASAWAASSLLRFEVITDVLAAVSRNDGSMGHPSTGHAEPFPELGPWLDFAASYDSSREFSWSTLELRNFRGRAPRMNPLAFRPLLASILWTAIVKTPPLDRAALVRQWIRFLDQNQSGLDQSPHLPPQTLAEWKNWLRQELRWIAGPVLSLDDELRATGLETDRTFEVANAVFVPDTKQLIPRGADGDVESGSSVVAFARETWALKSGDDETWLLTNVKSSQRHAWLRISESDWQALKPAHFFWAGCRAPSVREILRVSGGAEKLIFASLCERSSVTAAVRAFVQGGLQEMASSQPEVEFIQLRRSALELALRQGKIRAASRLNEFLATDDSNVFGIDTARWNSEMKAFRVVGAIEAVEYVRGGRFAGPRRQAPVPGSQSPL